MSKTLTIERPRIIENQKNTFYSNSLANPPFHRMSIITHVHSRPSPKEPGLLDRHNRQLQHHTDKPVATEFLGDTAHDQLVEDGANEKGDEHGDGLGEGGSGGEVDVAEEEVVHWDVPFAGEFEPVFFSC